MGERKIPFKVAYEIPSHQMIKKMVEKKLGITILCSSMIPSPPLEGMPRPVVIEDLHSYRHINIIYRRDQDLLPPLRCFMDFVRSHPERNIR